MKRKLHAKRLLRLLLTLLFITSLICPCLAASARFDVSAERLAGLNLLYGRDSGPALQERPTRAEAAVLLTRLLGGGKTAESEPSEHPFGDVPAWADGAVDYLYSRGVLFGVTETSFGPDLPCSAQMYCTLILRVLGYSDREDFSYENAVAFAEPLGLDGPALEEPFLRGNLAALSYAALGCQPKGAQGETLLERLAAAVPLPEAPVQALQSIFQIHRDVTQVMERYQGEQAAQLSMTGELEIHHAGVRLPIEIANTTRISGAGEHLQVESNTVTRQLIVGSEKTTYYRDGWCYVQNGDSRTKRRAAPDERFSPAAALLAVVPPVYGMESAAASCGTYQLFLMEAEDLIKPVLDSLGVSELENAALTALSPVISLTQKDGRLETYQLQASLQAAREDGAVMEIKMNLEVRVEATGPEVEVGAPQDPESYLEIH